MNLGKYTPKMEIFDNFSWKMPSALWNWKKNTTQYVQMIKINIFWNYYNWLETFKVSFFQFWVQAQRTSLIMH